jgi:hypothetical protein
VDWYGFFRGKLKEYAEPVTQLLPDASTAIAMAWSPSPMPWPVPPKIGGEDQVCSGGVEPEGVGNLIG